MLIAVTGGIGSGKSAVTEYLKARGANVISADEINAELLHTPEYIETLQRLFPDCVLNGAVDRNKLRTTIFNDREKRKLLNAVAHPKIMEEIRQRAGSLNGLTAVEIPLIDQAVDQSGFDRIIAVCAPLNARVDRVTKRDGVSRACAEAAIRAQASDAVYCAIATDVVSNAGDRSELHEKITRLLTDWGANL